MYTKLKNGAAEIKTSKGPITNEDKNNEDSSAKS